MNLDVDWDGGRWPDISHLLEYRRGFASAALEMSLSISVPANDAAKVCKPLNHLEFLPTDLDLRHTGLVANVHDFWFFCTDAKSNFFQPGSTLEVEDAPKQISVNAIKGFFEVDEV